MVKFLRLRPGDIVYQRSRSVRLGPSAVQIDIIELHADYALVRKGKGQPLERMYRKQIETLHWSPFPVPNTGKRPTHAPPLDAPTLSTKRTQEHRFNARNNPSVDP